VKVMAIRATTKVNLQKRHLRKGIILRIPIVTVAMKQNLKLEKINKAQFRGRTRMRHRCKVFKDILN